MIVRAIAAATLLTVGATGCTQVDRETQLQEFAKTCQVEYGFKIETPQFSQCMMALDQQSRADADRRRMAAAAALQGVSNSYNNAANSYRPVNCTHTPAYGGAVNTRCY
jgi:hypothetical protein